MNQKNLIGYIRVSTISQQSNSSLDEQKKMLLAYGVLPENIIEDIGSGRSLENRPNLKRFLDNCEKEKKFKVAEGENLENENKRSFVVCFLNRISRDYDNGLLILRLLEKYNYSFVPLDVPMLQSAEPSIRKLLFSLFVWLAEYELVSRKKAQLLGIAAAKERGVYSKSRKKTVLTESTLIAIKEKLKRNLTHLEIYRSLKISKSTFYSAKKKIDQEKI